MLSGGLVPFLTFISFLWSVNALPGFHHGKSLLYREPPIFSYGHRSFENITLETITQRVDNFDPQNNATYLMRYYRNDELFKAGAPIFVYVGGEWTIAPGSIAQGGIYELAKEFNGQLFYTEHRYYGKSHPTPNASTENLRFLSVDQALADLAHFIIEVKKEPRLQNSPVIVIGGSYSATMVTWFRQKYPHLVVGAWASSAPLFAKLDFIEYKEIVGAAIRTLGGNQCYNLLQNAFREAENLLVEQKYDEFNKAFGLCDTFDGANELDVWNFFSFLTDDWAGVVQYHSSGQLPRLCNSIFALSENSTDFETYTKWFRRRFTANRCLEISYANEIKQLKQTEWGSSATLGAGKQWFYQTCSEFGWFQTSDSQFQPFGSSFPVELYYRICDDVYGLNKTKMEKLIERKNTLYGGWTPSVENVFFTHGQVDPWRAMGVQRTQSKQSPATVIFEASHCQDLSSISPRDNSEMRAAKLKIRELVKTWINNK